MPRRIEKTVFISYRRTNFPWAYCIYQDLMHHGYDVFFDYQSIDSGNFEGIILDNIRARAHFIIILSSSALERCNQPSDWLRREIETAIDEKRNIIPIMLEGFDFGSPSVKQALTGKLSSLNTYNGMSLVSEYVEAGFEKLRNRFLNVALEDVVLHVLTKAAKEITESQKAAANEAPPIEKEQLTAQEWFERGFKSKDHEEQIRCFTEAIRLDPDLTDAYTGRGLANGALGKFNQALMDFDIAIGKEAKDEFAYAGRGTIRQTNDDLTGAIQDFDEAIRLNPTFSDAYANRGSARKAYNDLQGALADFNEAIRLQPDKAEIFLERGKLNHGQHNWDDAIKDFNEAIYLKQDEIEAFFFRGSARSAKGDLDNALSDFKEVIRLQPNKAEGFYWIGLVTSMKGDIDATFENLNKAIHLNPNYADAYYLRGLVYTEEHNLVAAIADYQKYLELGGDIENDNRKEVENKIKKLKNELSKKKTARKKKSK